MNAVLLPRVIDVMGMPLLRICFGVDPKSKDANDDVGRCAYGFEFYGFVFV